MCQSGSDQPRLPRGALDPSAGPREGSSGATSRTRSPLGRWRRELRARWGAALRGLAISAGLSCVPGCGAQPDSVLLVTIDTLRADHVGAYGFAAARTRTLDALAQDGVRFEQAISPAPITLTSHASLMTGTFPPRHGVRDNGLYRLGAQHVTLAERLRDAGLATGAFVGAFVLDGSFGLDQGFEVYDDRMSDQRSGAVGYAERSAAAVADAAAEWLAELAPGRRFFAWVHFYDPHAEYAPPPGFLAALPGRPYDAEIAYVDFHLGRLLDVLASLERRENTLVVVTSDHGESLGEHGEPTHTHFVYDATQRVPLILSGPGVPPGAVVDAQVRLIDVAPTVLDLLGLPPLHGAQGVSLAPLFGRGAAPPQDAYVETLATRSLGWSPLVGLRRDGWKYIRAPRPELYQLDADPAELVNRIAERPELARELDARLEALMSDAAAAAETVALDADEKRRLESLGYVVANRAGGTAPLAFDGVDPKDGIAAGPQLNRVSGLLEAGRFAEALDVALDLRRRFPDGRLYIQLEALLRLRLGDAERAAERIAEVNRRYPEDADAWELRAEAEVARGRLDAARRALETARAHHPDHPQLARAAVAVELDGGDVPSARRRLDDARSRRSDDLELLVLSGRVREAEGSPGEARRAYEGVLERAPGHADATLRLALLEIASGDSEAGARRLERLPEAQRAALTTGLAVARAFVESGDRERAAEALTPCLQPGVESAVAWDAQGALLLELGHVERAEAALRRALMLEPGRVRAANNLAALLAREGRDLDRALELARENAAAVPGPATADTLAEVHLARGEPQAALEAAERGLEAGATGDAAARLHYLIGRALRELGRPGEARESLSRALEGVSDPSQPWLAEARRLEESS